MSKKTRKKKTKMIFEYILKLDEDESITIRPKDAEDEIFIITPQKDGKIKITIESERGD